MLNDAEVAFLIVGGVAVVAYGYGRLTQDVDLVVRMDSTTIHKTFHSLATLAYRPRVPVTPPMFADPDQRRKWVEEKGMVVLSFHSDRHRETPIDLFVTEPFDFDREYERATVEHLSEDVPVRLVALETLLQMKRETGRLKDLADIEELDLLHGRPGDG